MKTARKTVFVCIPAYNEEGNILSLLKSLLRQKGENFNLEGIGVFCDGSTDKTESIVLEYRKKYPFIQVVSDSKRKGKARRLNEFYRGLKADIGITCDADIVLGHDYVLSEMVKEFDDDKVGLVGGYDIPLPQHTFIGKIVATYEYFWREVKSNVAGGDNVHSHPGLISAGRREFLKTVVIPAGIVAEDHFLYFQALKQGFCFKSAKDAVVYFKVPATMADYLKQATRFHDSANDIRGYFGGWVNEYYHIPYQIKLRAYIVTFFKNPFYFAGSILLQVIQRVFGPRFAEKSNSGIWAVISSSK